MAITYFWLFPSLHLKPNMAVFWFMMQIAMIAGFLTALPANAWLIRKGWKEKMPKIDPNQWRLRCVARSPPQGWIELPDRSARSRDKWNTLSR